MTESASKVRGCAVMRVQFVSSVIPVIVLLAGALAQEPSRDSRFSKPLRMGQRDDNTFVGIVTDSRCGAKHRMTDKSAEECARACQRAGAAYALVAGETLYILEGRHGDVSYLAGQKVKVSGKLSGKTITVTSIGPTQ